MSFADTCVPNETLITHITVAKMFEMLCKTVEKLILLLYPSLENANVLTLPTTKTNAAQGACAWS
jgi:hypothetical protein